MDKRVINTVSKIDNRVRIQNVICSVSDKTDLDILARELVAINPQVTIYSTGGTYIRLEEVLGGMAEKHLVPVSRYTGQPEMQGGLVKTLDFKIYLGLLSETYNPDHARDIQRTSAVAVDLVIVNLYPFEDTINQVGATPEQARANIDIGGPTLIRAAAKNYLRVGILTDPVDYRPFLDDLDAAQGWLDLEQRFALAQKAFCHTAAYEAAICRYWSSRSFNDITGLYQHGG